MTHSRKPLPPPPCPPRYQYVTTYVSGNDMADGLRVATDLFEAAMIRAFESCKQLHVIIFAVTASIMAVYILLLFRWEGLLGRWRVISRGL